ncbi:MAG: sensor histidine kinase [Propioniciclava sp.]|uniref:sensor histidine kinase n=1 Tax=Propioniciclava sp. TaxID=2038686 RepID=UPI0039E6D281
MNTSDALFPPGATQRDWVADGFLAVSLTLASVVYHLFNPPPGYYSGFIFLLLTSSMTMPLLLRRHAPLVMLVLCTLAGSAHLVVFDGPTVSLIAVPIVSYSVARWVPGPLSRSVIVIGAFASVLGPMRWFVNSATNPSADILFWAACFGAVLTPYAIGRRSREVADARIRQVEAAEERYTLLLAEREQQARLAEASTRAMIARELHDIVAHSLSVMIVQAEGGRAAATRKPEVAAEALDTIAETGREALHEMRRIVGVLRAGPDAEDRPAFAPSPTLHDIPDLVARTSERATLIEHGTPYAVSPTLALTVYRVTQEALTNFLKHAGPGANATVTLAYSPGSITVDVLDDGDGVENPTDGGGNGLRGMHERVTSMGGVLRAGPLNDGPGFRVTATLPAGDVPSTPPSPRS